MNIKSIFHHLLFFLPLAILSHAFASDISDVAKVFHLDELHQPAPNFSFSDAQGKILELKDYRGKAILLHFWASWCSPCQRELPDLRRFSSQLDLNRWVFLPISTDEAGKRSAAIEFLGKIGMKSDFRSVQESKDVEKYLTWGLPVTYLISPTGEIIARALGQHEWIAKSSAVHKLNELFIASVKTSK